MGVALKRNVRQLRLAQRFPTDFPGGLRVGRDRHAITIADISAGGAKVRCAVAMPLSAPVVLEIGQREIAAHVVWRSQSGCGLRFACAVSPLEIVRQTHPTLRAIFGAAAQSRRGETGSDQVHAPLRAGAATGRAS